MTGRSVIGASAARMKRQADHQPSCTWPSAYMLYHLWSVCSMPTNGSSKDTCDQAKLGVFAPRWRPRTWQQGPTGWM